MGNCCKAASSMEWGGEDWESLKVFDEASHLDHRQKKENDMLEKLRDSCDVNGRVTLKISKSELAELLGAIQQNNNNNHQQAQHHIKNMTKKKKELGSAEQVLYRLIKAKDQEIVNKNHCNTQWKPMLESISES
ncbi:uncharacterized protein LOC127135095 [Lathyrus oleraceus]|uniref:Uncharacterized protein n=1 Tax=Pisum sativum TaxID=3888 RepID=A0A9D5APE2_PEA|nr:uncharacterized protein LOC127135095 [Pisum sativum]KAI5414606.1 hypothetical protein KIW84_040188 [Pisum sativum]